MPARSTAAAIPRVYCGILVAALASQAAAGIGALQQLELLDGEAGPIRGLAVVVDLGPDVEVVVTAPTADAGEAKATTVADWAELQGLSLAINANFFGVDRSHRETLDVIGLSVSNGRIVSPPRQYEGVFDFALAFDREGKARIAPLGGDDLASDSVWDAVAGVGPSAANPKGGSLLVTDGRNTALNSRVQATVKHPRTAVGVDAEGTRLWLVVIDGRQPGWSVGMTLPELADLLIEMGVDDAINLDGGGSSTLVYRHGEGEWQTNRPSDGTPRPVANHLGFRLKGQSTSETANGEAPSPQALADIDPLSGAPITFSTIGKRRGRHV